MASMSSERRMVAYFGDFKIGASHVGQVDVL